ncbi:MAG: Crp/Fnr family transcriptional regulator [Janthinobacterium lividum]
MTPTSPGRDSLAFLPGASSLARKLALFVPLPEGDRRALDALLVSEEQFPADADIVAEGAAPRSVFLLQAGMAVRYRNLRDGRRQIMTFLIPGDLCNPHMFLLKAMDHSIGSLTSVRIAALSREGLMRMSASRPRVSAALWWSTLQEESMLRERIVSLGRRDARGRVAYLLCELLWRFSAMGLAEGGMYRLPLTQTELGDALGLTPVHINRVLKEFREQRLIAMEQRLLKVLDIEGLQNLAAFNKEYLHLDHAPADIAKHIEWLEREQAHDKDCLAADDLAGSPGKAGI